MLSLKKSMRLLSSVLLMIMLILQMTSGTVFAVENSKTIDIVEITDFHGTLEDTYGNQVAQVMAKNIDAIRTSNPQGTLVVSGGDNYQGSALSNLLKGVPVMKVFDAIGVEVSAVGNHEFDWGIDTVTKSAYANRFVCSNIYYKGTDKHPFDAYRIFEKDGVKIAIVGAITETAPSIILSDYIKDYDVRSAAESINQAAKAARDEGARIVIALVHEGDNYDNKTGPLFDITNKLSGVDAVLGGHTHSIVDTKTSGGIPVAIANNAGKGFIDMKITLPQGEGRPTFDTRYYDISGMNYSPKASEPKADTTKPWYYTGWYGYKYSDSTRVKEPIYESVYNIIDEAKKEVGPILNERLGYAPIELTRNQANPHGDSQLGNWASDVTRERVGADFGFQNNGGLRIDIPKGDITVSTLYAFMPFDNTIVTSKMSAEEIKTILEEAEADGGKGIQVSGLRYFYDPSLPSGSRVTSVTKDDGTPLDPKVEYTVATNNFVGGGGDGFDIFKSVTVNDKNILVRDALSDDIKRKGELTSSIDGRISRAASVTLLATSDIHGYVYPYDYFTGAYVSEGLAKVSTYVKNQRKIDPNLILVDNGDSVQGSSMATYYATIDKKNPNPIISVMNYMKYDTWTLGNHEFNFGMDMLGKFVSEATAGGIHVLSANTHKEDDSSFVDPYFIKTVNTSNGAIKVGILGLTTKTIPSWENPDNYKGLHFTDIVEEAKKRVPEIKAKGADIVVAVVHSGEESSSDIIPENEIKVLAGSVDGIDAIVAGHTHQSIAQDTFKSPSGNTVVVTEPGKYGQYVSNVRFSLVKNQGAWKLVNVSSSLAAMNSSIEADKNVLDLVKDCHDTTLNYLGTVIGKSTGEFSAAKQTTEETAIMDLVNYIQKETAGADISIAAPLSSTAVIHNGDVTIRDISSIYVYENYLYSIKMTGKQLKDWLEFSARYYKQTSSSDDPAIKDPALNIPDYNLDQAYGVEYVIDITQPAGSRIKNLKYKGKPVKDDDTLIAAINNYRYNGGGGFMAAAGLTPGNGAIYDSMKLLGDNGQVRNLIIDYVKSKGVISPVKESFWEIRSTPDKELDPDEIHVNSERLSDISLNIGDNTLVSIMNGTGTLIHEVDYKVSGNVITINKWYLGYYFTKFPDHNLYLKFNFENGKSSVLTVYTGNTPHVVLTPETLPYDVKSGDAGLGLILNGNFISGIKGDDSALAQRIDYSYAPNSQILYIRKGYLNTFFSKNTGPLKLTVYFTGDQPRTVVLSPVK